MEIHRSNAEIYIDTVIECASSSANFNKAAANEIVDGTENAETLAASELERLERNGNLRLRYRPKAASKRDQYLTFLFQKAFKNARENTDRNERARWQVMPLDQAAFIEKAQKAGGNQCFYSAWRKVVWIDIPKALSEIINTFFVKVALSVHFFYHFGKFCIAAYERITDFCHARLIPVIINNTPISVIRTGNLCASGAAWFSSKIYPVLVAAWLGRLILGIFFPSVRNRFPVLNVVEVYAQNIYNFIALEVLKNLLIVWNSCTKASLLLRRSALETKREVDGIYYKKSFHVFKTLTAVPARRSSQIA